MDPRKHCFTQPSCDKKPKCVKKQNLLVYDKSNPCVDKSSLPKTCYGVTPLKKANAKKIRVCTGADLKRMCPPKLCTCPTKRPKKGFGQIGRALAFGVKSAVAGGLIYWTYGIGLWGRPDETEKIYVDLCKYAFKPDKKQLEMMLQEAREQQACFNKTCDVFAARNKQIMADARDDALMSEDSIMAQMNVCQKAPSIRENANSLKNRWNRWVISCFEFVVSLPARLCPAKKEEKAEEKSDEKKKKEAPVKKKECQKGDEKCKERAEKEKEKIAAAKAKAQQEDAKKTCPNPADRCWARAEQRARAKADAD